MLTDKAYYKIEQNSNEPRTRKDLLSVHSIETFTGPIAETDEGKRAFCVYAYKHTMKQNFTEVFCISNRNIFLNHMEFI